MRLRRAKANAIATMMRNAIATMIGKTEDDDPVKHPCACKNKK
jgi:hypothetical protein